MVYKITIMLLCIFNFSPISAGEQLCFQDASWATFEESSQNEEIRYLTAGDKCSGDSCKRAHEGYPKNPYENVCNSPKCPHGR